jgi:uncharacterized protein
LNLDICIKTLNDSGCPPHIINHCKAVSEKAVDMATNFQEHNSSIDLDKVEMGALLHDIGRSKTHTIKHAVVGAEILRNLDFPSYIINITMKHIGAGIPENEAKILGLPPGDYMPYTFEEKIVAHADNLINGTNEVDLEYVIIKWEKIFGKNHPAISRLKNLHKELII